MSKSEDESETSATKMSPGKVQGGGSSSSIKCPMLNSSNYLVWSMRMKILLKVNKSWEIVETGKGDDDKNDLAIALIFQSIPEKLILQVGELDSAKEVWEAIKTRHVGAERVKEARLQTLMAEFDRLKMKESEKIDDFAGKLAEIQSKTASLGEEIEESKIVKKFLKSLPRRKYIHIVASLEQVLDLNNTSFEDIIGRLKAYEERVAEEEEEEQGEQNALMYSQSEFQNRAVQTSTKGEQNRLLYSNSENQGRFRREINNEARNRGRGGRYFGNRGRGRGRYNSYRDSTNRDNRDMSKVQCWRCDKFGHYVSDCPDRLLKLQEAQLDENQDTEDADELMLHEVVYLNEEKVIPNKYEENACGDDIWYLDNGASNHMSGDKRYFSNIDETITGKVKFGDDSRIDIKGKGTVEFTDRNGEVRILAEVYYIPDLKSNIISLGQATEAGCEVNMKGEFLTMHDSSGKLLVRTARSKNRLYKVHMGIKDTACLHLMELSSSDLWHARLGHINLETMKSMVHKELVIGIPQAKFDVKICDSCLLGKQTRQVFPQATSYRATRILELIHGDLCGPITPSTPAGKRYIFVLIDDHSRYMWTILLKEKSDTFDKFKKFKVLVEQDSGKKIQTFRTDRGGEFVSHDFSSYCDESGIKRHLTAPYTPQQNGVVERRNRTLLEMTRSILKHMILPNYLWGEAIRHSTYLLNRIATRALNDKTPYEAYRGRKPNLAHLRVFGCIGYAKVEKQHLKKLDDRSRRLIHLGTEPGSKAYRLFDPQTKKIMVSRDVVFDESKGWNWNQNKEITSRAEEFVISLGDFGNRGIREASPEIFEIVPDLQRRRQLEKEDKIIETPRTDRINSGTEHESGFERTQNHGTAEDTISDEDDSEGTEDDNEDDEAKQEQQPRLRRTQRISAKPAYLEDYVLLAELEGEYLLMCVNDEPRSFDEARSLKVWMQACEEELCSIKKNFTWSLVDPPHGVKPIGLKWVFKLKRNSDGSINKHKARLVAKGYVQRHGVDFDEVFAPVARIETIRLLINLAASNGWEIHHLDVKTAFLHGELKETVYVTQPEGFEVKGSEEKVYKLHKALYGLRQAPRAWNNKLNRILKELQFKRCSKEPSVYRKEKEMSTKFEMSDLGKLTYYLGIEVCQTYEGITLSQQRYALKILEEAGMKNCNPVHTPMEAGLKLSKSAEEQDIDATSYRRNVGCLRYLLHTRPDLSYSVGVLSRYMQNPKESHGNAMKQCLRYLKGTVTLGLSFKRSSSKRTRLIGYSDSSHNVDPDDGKSTTGHVFYLGGSPITWCSQKQDTVALSSCEAEFMAGTEAARQAIWLQDLLGEITGSLCEKVTIRIDNRSAIALTKNPVFHGRSKHIHTRYHFIRECVENGQIEVEHVPGNEQKADILTKALGRLKFKEMRELIGIQDVKRGEFKLRRENVE